MTKSASPRNCKRRWLQFSLRGVLLCLLAAALVFGWIARKLATVQEQRTAVIAIQGMGGDVAYESHKLTPWGAVNGWLRKTFGDDFFDSVKQVHFQRADDKRWTPEEVRKFGVMATADQLSRWEPWTRENILQLQPHLEKLKKLKTLSIDQTVIPRHGLMAISELQALRHLDLKQTQITSVDLQYLANLQQLESLRLRRTRIRDDGLAYLTGLSQLTSLNLGSTAVGDGGLKHVAHLTNLETLILENTEVTDAGMSNLHGLTKLKLLHLGLTDVSDESIGYIKDLTELETLVVGDKVTSAGIASLKRSLESCSIRHSAYRGRQL